MKISTNKIETALAEQEMTKAELACRCEITRQHLSSIIKRGTCEPRTVGKLAKGLNVKVSYITANEEDSFSQT